MTLPAVPPGMGYETIFRVMVVQFLDAYTFNVRSVKRACIHIAHPDGRIIPFDTYNLFYREGCAGAAVMDLLEAMAPAPLWRSPISPAAVRQS